MEGCGEYINARMGIRCGNKNYNLFCEDCLLKDANCVKDVKDKESEVKNGTA